MDIPTSVTGMLIGAGLLLLITGLIGGGLEIKEIKIPKIALVTRISCFCVGTVLITLAMWPILNQNIENTQLPVVPEGIPETGEFILVSPLSEMSEISARKELEKLGLKVGKVTYKSIWAPDYQVVEHFPKAESKVKLGTKVDLVVARSEFNFRVERKITSKTESISVVVDYKVKRLLPEETADEIGEFIITRSVYEPFDAKFQKIFSKLKSTPGYVPIGSLNEYKLESSWEAFAELFQQVEEQIAQKNVTGNASDFSEIGEAAWLALINMEIEFDIKTIFSTMAKSGNPNSKSMNLQIANDLKSAIKVEGPPSLVAAGKERKFNVLRRTPKSNSFETVGRTSYSVPDGLLKKFKAMFYIGEDEKTHYVIKIERM